MLVPCMAQMVAFHVSIDAVGPPNPYPPRVRQPRLTVNQPPLRSPSQSHKSINKQYVILVVLE